MVDGIFFRTHAGTQLRQCYSLMIAPYGAATFVAAGIRARAHPQHLILFRRHIFAFSRLISPELCSLRCSLGEKGRREGRAPAGTRGPVCEQDAHGVDYR
ncbi:hypothetical protein XH99_09280 [Bradyrhizobium nanningense]|uniref:Uncharacterized protein n=1 Tax=Bradyrhizobium nanningense TaxID=1325118 RepID=A0A4Q0SG86_9BRAD|nr:hypothetical protein XH99_09280 [Bradyrhizobium nanningense]RXH36001.1 hypothetical protein XH84_01805 [Bradyrhizobium nanningense]TQF30759.1 hypothetical protein UNPA324_14925 [Bradyrhizobium sp. UNPA324]